MDGNRYTLVMVILRELQSCTDAARAWTGNWSMGTITRMQTVLDMDTLTKKQCGALMLKLVHAYTIIAQGANETLM